MRRAKEDGLKAPGGKTRSGSGRLGHSNVQMDCPPQNFLESTDCEQEDIAVTFASGPSAATRQRKNALASFRASY